MDANQSNVLYYDMKTGKIVNEEVRKAFETRSPIDSEKRFGIVPTGAYVKDNYVFFNQETGRLLTREEVDKMNSNSFTEPQTGKFYEPDNNIDLDDDILKIFGPDNKQRTTQQQAEYYNQNYSQQNYSQQRPQQNYNQQNYGQQRPQQNNNQQNAKYQKAHDKSVTPQKHLSKRNKNNFIYKAKGYVITFAVAAALVGTPQVVNMIKDNNTIQSEKTVYAQIYNDSHTDKTDVVNFVTPYKFNTGGYDKDYNPAWDYDYNGIVKNFLSYDDKYFVSNFKKLYDDLRETKYWTYEGDTTILDNIVSLISKKVAENPEAYPTAFTYLDGVNNFDEFLNKNYSIYTNKKDEDLEDVYKKIVRDQIVLEAPQMLNEYGEKEVSELMTDAEDIERGGR